MGTDFCWRWNPTRGTSLPEFLALTRTPTDQRATAPVLAHASSTRAAYTDSEETGAEPVFTWSDSLAPWHAAQTLSEGYISSQFNWSKPRESVICSRPFEEHKTQIGIDPCIHYHKFLATCCNVVSCSVYFRPWRWRRYVPAKRHFTYRLYGAMF